MGGATADDSAAQIAAIAQQEIGLRLTGATRHAAPLALKPGKVGAVLAGQTNGFRWSGGDTLELKFRLISEQLLSIQPIVFSGVGRFAEFDFGLLSPSVVLCSFGGSLLWGPIFDWD